MTYMEGKRKISQYRERFDRTLASADLTNEETVKTLVRNQILRSSENETDGVSEQVLEKRTVEVSNFLDMLRSASVDDHAVSKSKESSRGEWKLKEDNEEFRVMYREGPEGTPLHTLLVEGYVDGPVDVCLCVSWESELYRKWWPQSSFPPFRITACKSLQRIRVGEQISLVRVKIAWPLSSREAVVHYFLFEIFQDDLIVILINTVSDVSSISKITHGFSNDGIPEAKDVVRIDLVGGFAMQKVTEERSYFRTIANMDLKVDFVPAALINFIARQLIGSGFRLYQKVVASVSGSHEDYGKVLKDPLYAQIREALYSTIESNGALVEEENELEEHFNEVIVKDKSNVEQNSYSADDAAEPLSEKTLDSEHITRHAGDGKRNMELSSDDDDGADVPLANNVQDISDGRGFSEIEEEREQEDSLMEGDVEVMNQPSRKELVDDQNSKNRFCPSPEVSQGLETLERAISVVRKYRLQSISYSDSSGDPVDLANVIGKESNFTAAHVHSEDIAIIEERSKDVGRTSNNSENGPVVHDIRLAGSSSLTKEVNHHRVAPLSLRQGVSTVDAEQVAVIDFDRRITMNGIHENNLNKVRKSINSRRKNMLCCFGSPGSE